jgi:hypothetical protein
MTDLREGYPYFIFAAVFKRESTFYLWHIIFPAVLLVCLGFSVILIEQFSDQLANTMIVFLCAVAFRHSICNYMPNCSYLCIVDIYLLVIYISQPFTLITINFI